MKAKFTVDLNVMMRKLVLSTGLMAAVFAIHASADRASKVERENNRLYAIPSRREGSLFSEDRDERRSRNEAERRDQALQRRRAEEQTRRRLKS